MSNPHTSSALNTSLCQHPTCIHIYHICSHCHFTALQPCHFMVPKSPYSSYMNKVAYTMLLSFLCTVYTASHHYCSSPHQYSTPPLPGVMILKLLMKISIHTTCNTCGSNTIYYFLNRLWDLEAYRADFWWCNPPKFDWDDVYLLTLWKPIELLISSCTIFGNVQKSPMTNHIPNFSYTFNRLLNWQLTTNLKCCWETNLFPILPTSLQQRVNFLICYTKQ